MLWAPEGPLPYLVMFVAFALVFLVVSCALMI